MFPERRVFPEAAAALRTVGPVVGAAVDVQYVRLSNDDVDETLVARARIPASDLSVVMEKQKFLTMSIFFMYETRNEGS